MIQKLKKHLNFKIIETNSLYPFLFTLFFVFLTFQYPFSTLESIFYDFRVRNDLGFFSKSQIVVITMDEESDEFLGEQYPYTYASHHRLFSKFLNEKPKIINYLLNPLGPESEMDGKNFIKFKKAIESFKSAGGYFRFGVKMDVWGEQYPPIGLKEFGYSLAVLNRDDLEFSKDKVVRRAILNISGDDTLHMWTANKYRKFLGKNKLESHNLKGAFYQRDLDATVVSFRYSSSPMEKDKRIIKIPFHKVVVGNFPKGFFKDKIVIVGPSYISNSGDYSFTPFDRENLKAPNIFLHSLMIQSLVENKTVIPIPKTFTYIFSLLIVLFLSIFINKAQPTSGLIITISLMFGILLFSFCVFSIFGFWVYTTHLIMSIFIVYYIWVPFRAIAEYKTRFAIQEEAKLIKEVESLKQNFISLMSHDLKTPVAKISGMVDIIMMQVRGQAEIENNLKMVMDSTKELNNFITSILDLTKIESSKLNLQKTSKDVNQIVRSVVEGFKFEAERKQIKLNTELAPLYPIKIDVNLFKRIASNLIENAIKYSGKGKVVDIKTWDDEKWVYIEVIDNGVGIGQNDIKRVFDRFYRVKNDASHSIKGTGLGLYLVKYFVELHGGKISVESELGRGTQFKVQLLNV